MKIYKFFKKFNLLLRNNSSLLSAWASLIAIFGIPLILLGGFNAWLQVEDYINRPDIDLLFKNPKNMTFTLTNTSSTLLRDPSYLFALWDLDARKEGKGDDPGNLMIPTKNLNYIRPNSGSGPYSIKNLTKVSKKVPDGHIIFGWASVQCPECISQKNYWILIKKGESAWYSKIEEKNNIFLYKELFSVLDDPENYSKKISEIVPLNKRVGVQDSFY